MIDCEIKDPSHEHLKEHSFECIFNIAVAAIIEGAESWYDVSDFGKFHEDFFRSRIPGFKNVPSHDTFNRVFSLLSPHEFEKDSAVGYVKYAANTMGLSPLMVRRTAM